MSETTVATLLFTDLVDSTALSQRLGEDRAEALRREHTQALRDAVGATGGEEVKHMGDGIMAAFTSPSDALRCAIGMQQAVERQNRTLPEPLGLRVGLHVGEVTQDGGDYFGTAVVVAERLCRRADGGQIFTTDVLRALVGSRGGHTFKELGPLELKGIDDPVQSYDLQWEPLAAEVPLPSFFLSVERPFFVGRTEEHEQLRTEWTRAAHERRVALLAGEPGIGKTRLCTELAFEAHEQGAVVLYGRCDEDPSISYQPFAEALRHYVEHCPDDELRTHVADHGGEITLIVPELVKRIPDAPPPIDPQTIDPTADRDAERYRLFEAVAGLLIQATERAPLLLVLDDLHWATRPTLLLLRHLIRGSVSRRLFVLGTYRDTDLSRSHPLAEMLADWRRELDVERISLSGLSEAGVLDFVQAASDQAAGVELAALATELYGETEGNPFFTGQVLRHLVESGLVYRRDERWTYDGSVSDLRIPEGVREVIGRRLSRLSEGTNRALAVAAVIGSDFELGVLERVPDALSHGDPLDAVDEAMQARIIVEVPEGRGRYRFTHTLVRQTLYEELSSARRARIHRSVGEAIEERYAADLGPHIAFLARHFGEGARSGDISKAAAYATEAARQALARAAYEEVIQLCERGAHVLDLDDAPRDAERATLLALSVEARFSLLDVSAIEDGAEALRLAMRAGSLEVMARVAAYYGAMAPFAGRSEEAVELCRQALALLEDHPALQVQVLFALIFLGQATASGEGEALSDHAVELARVSGDAWSLGAAIFTRAFLFRDSLAPAEVLAFSEELFVCAEAVGGVNELAESHRLRRVARLAVGDRRRYEEDSAAVGRLGEQTRNGLYQVVGIATPAILASLDGRFADVEPLLREYMTRWGHSPVIQVAYAYRVIGVRYEQGLFDGALQMARRLLAAGSGRLLPARSFVALIGAAMGDDEGARADLDYLAQNDFGDLVRAGSHLTSYANLAEVTCILGDDERAARLYELMPKRSRELILNGDAWFPSGSIDRTIGILAGTIGRFDEAETRFEAALDFEESIPARALATRTRYCFARMLHARKDSGDVERAAQLLDSCITNAREFGMADLLAKAETLRG